MKNVLAMFAVLALAVGTATADDAQVSSSALSALGLGQMEILTDDAGMEVRGMTGSNAFAMGASVGASILIDVFQPGNYSIGTDTNSDRGSDEQLAASVFSGVAAGLTLDASNDGQGSAVTNDLDTAGLINGNGMAATPVFSGLATLAAGTAATIGNGGVSNATAN